MKSKLLACFILLGIALILVRMVLACPGYPPSAYLVVSYENSPDPLINPTEVTLDGSLSADFDSFHLGLRGIKTFEWDFGDGTPNYSETSGETPGDGDFDGETTHWYRRPGTYTVTLTVTDFTDDTDTATAIVEYKGDINFNLEILGTPGSLSRELRISYNAATAPVLPRSIALKCVISNGYLRYYDGGILDPVIQSYQQEFNCFMDSAYTEGVTYDLGLIEGGQGLAKPDGPGELPLEGTISEFSINMAVFDQVSQSRIPPTSDNLLTLKVFMSTPSTITVSEDLMRSSLSRTGITTNLPITKQRD
jgi:hypothetical protein